MPRRTDARPDCSRTSEAQLHLHGDRVGINTCRQYLAASQATGMIVSKSLPVAIVSYRTFWFVKILFDSYRVINNKTWATLMYEIAIKHFSPSLSMRYYTLMASRSVGGLQRTGHIRLLPLIHTHITACNMSVSDQGYRVLSILSALFFLLSRSTCVQCHSDENYAPYGMRLLRGCYSR